MNPYEADEQIKMKDKKSKLIEKVVLIYQNEQNLLFIEHLNCESFDDAKEKI